MNLVIATANQWGAALLHAGGTMLWQSSLLALVILALDFGLSRWVRASVRHALWLVLLVKLVLPTSFALPTSPAWWVSRRATESAQFLAPVAPPSDPTIFDDDAASLHFAPSTAPSAPDPLLPLTLAAWGFAVALAGSIGLFAWLLWRHTQVLRLCRLAADAPQLDSLVAKARELAGLDTRVRVKISPGTMSPAVCGLLHPVILLPQSLVEILSPDQLRAVVLHELIHLRRGDVWINCLQGLLQTVYWWHPLVWLANARIRRVREEAVDDAVMVALQADADIYAPTLIAVARFALRRPLGSLGLVGILESRSALRQRIERLVDSPVPARAGLSVGSVLGLVGFSVIAVPMGSAPPPPAVGGVYEVMSADALFSVNRMDVPLSRARDFSATNGTQVPWPDPHFNGYQSVNLRADFFMLDESALRAKVPELGNGQTPVAIGPDEADDLATHLKQAGAHFFNNYEAGIDVPGISGTLQHYFIGGFPRQPGTAEFTTTNIDGHSLISGTEISLSASQPGWTPVDFSVRPWQAADQIRCEVKLGTGGSPHNFQSAELTVPAGGALVWVTTAAVKPGKCQVIFLMPWNASSRLSSATFQHRRIPLTQGFAFFIEDNRQRGWQHPAESIWRGYNGSIRHDDDYLYPLLHEAGLNWLPPRQLTYNFFNSLDVYAPAKDIKVIESAVASISETEIQNDIAAFLQAGKLSYENGKFDEAATQFNRVFLWDPTNASARYYLDQIAQVRQGGRPATASSRSESQPNGTRLLSFLLTADSGLSKFRDQTGLAAGSSPDEYLAGFRKLLASRGAGLPTHSVWLSAQSLLMVRGSPQELAAVESLFEELNGAPAPVQTAAAKLPPLPPLLAVATDFEPPPAMETNLYMRTFKVNLSQLKSFARLGPIPDQSLTTNRTDSAEEYFALRNLFKGLGVDLKPPEASFLNDRLGWLFVRATTADLDAVERIVESLNQPPLAANHG